MTIRVYFSGDYVDRGEWGVEVFCLLSALKARYPDAVYLLRGELAFLNHFHFFFSLYIYISFLGNHEDPSVNVDYGFKKECTRYYDRHVWPTFTVSNPHFHETRLGSTATFYLFRKCSPICPCALGSVAESSAFTAAFRP